MLATALLCLVVGISDGDTLTARCGDPGGYEQVKVRIHAIDARSELSLTATDLANPCLTSAFSSKQRSSARILTATAAPWPAWSAKGAM